MKSNPSKTVLTISIGFTILFWIYKFQWMLTFAVIIGLIGIFSDYLSLLIEKAWMKLAFILSLIVPNIILGIVFFIFLLPLSWLSKLFRKEDTLQLKNRMLSVYKEKNKTYDKAHFENMW